jgi:hypothetical protein
MKSVVLCCRSNVVTLKDESGVIYRNLKDSVAGSDIQFALYCEEE